MRENVLLYTLRDEEKPLIHLTKLRYLASYEPSSPKNLVNLKRKQTTGSFNFDLH